MFIVDDGSDDGTREIVESLADSRIMLIERAHEGIPGLGRSYAMGLERASSPLIAVLEGDDTWPPNKLAFQAELFSDPSLVLSYGSAGLIDENGSVYARYRYKPRGSIASNLPIGSIMPALIRRVFIVASTVMIRRASLDRIGGFSQPSGMKYVDLPTWLLLATQGTFKHSPEVLGNWRRHSHQITTRSWFEPPTDRAPCLRAIANEGKAFVNPEILASIEQAIQEDASQQREETFLFQGRIALLSGKWSDATKLFLKVLSSGHGLTRLAGGLGIMCAGARIDMERFMNMAGAHSLPSRHHVRISHN